MAQTELIELTIAAAATALAAKQISPVELTQAYLERIERLDPLLNAYITVTAESALEEARAAEQAIGRGGYRGPLHGVPVGLKDLYATAGVRTTGGSKILADWVPDQDATVTAKLKAAGAVLLGKLNTHEFAFGTSTSNPHYGPTRNPWNRDHIPGGSSGGSGAAVAAGLAVMAMGSDTGGSIRMPASLCGVVGLKPTHGRVSTAGVLPLAWSLDHAGPLARTVEDAAIVLQAIAGSDPRDTLTPPVPVPDFCAGLQLGIRGAKLGVLRAGFCEGVDAEVLSAFEAALDVLRGLGAEIEDVEAAAIWDSRAAGGTIMLAEAQYIHAAWLVERPDDYGNDVRARLTSRSGLTAAELVGALRQRDAAIRASEALLNHYLALLTPTMRLTAPPIGEPGELGRRAAELSMNTLPFDVTMQPALSMPCGFDSGGLPVGLQITSKRWDEPAALRVGAAYEAATDWHTRRPPLG